MGGVGAGELSERRRCRRCRRRGRGWGNGWGRHLDRDPGAPRRRSGGSGGGDAGQRLAGGGRRADPGRSGPGRRHCRHGRAHPAQRGRGADGAIAGGRRRPGRARARRALRGRARGRPGGGGGQAGWARRPPGCGPRRRDPGRGPAGSLSRPGRSGGFGCVRSRSAGDRAPARQGNLGASGGGAHRRGVPGARRPAGHEDDGASVSGTGGRRGGRGPGSGRGTHRPVRADAHEDGRDRRREAGQDRLHGPGPPGRWGSAPTTLLELSLESGRTHQIRVHMAAIGHPVVGDARYGVPDRRLGTGRFFLHAHKLAFEHPGTGARTTFTSPLPEDLTGYLG